MRAAHALARTSSSAAASTSSSSAAVPSGAIRDWNEGGRWSTRIGHDRCQLRPGRTRTGPATCRDDRGWTHTSCQLHPAFTRSFAASPQPAEDATDDDIGPVTLIFSELVDAGDSPLVAYERLSKQGVLRWDEAQHRALETLNTLHAKLVGDMDGGAAKAKAKSEAPKKDCLLYTSPSPRD